MDDKVLIGEIIKANATKVYEDAAQPSIRVVGKSLAQCISLFVTPIGSIAEILEGNINRYLSKLTKYKEEELKPPDVRILVPVLEKMRYTKEEEVAEYYAQILANATVKSNASKVLVSYIEILNRLCADEIKILEFINSNENKIDLSGLSKKDREEFDIEAEEKYGILKGTLPVVDIQFKEKGRKGTYTIRKNFCLLHKSLELKNPENVGSYLDNLLSLGLLDRPPISSLIFVPAYFPLEDNSEISDIKDSLTEDKELLFNRSRMNLTDLAKHMLELCTERN